MLPECYDGLQALWQFPGFADVSLTLNTSIDLAGPTTVPLSTQQMVLIYWHLDHQVVLMRGSSPMQSSSTVHLPALLVFLLSTNQSCPQLPEAKRL